MSSDISQKKLGVVFNELENRAMLIVNNTMVDIYSIAGIIETTPERFELLFNKANCRSCFVGLDSIAIDADTAKAIISRFYKPIACYTPPPIEIPKKKPADTQSSISSPSSE
ncbi:hypothetical protein [Armatimonas sp.]|uniref:hypothetical protein n=1 Tax=Armatimonas sp. TaxID=1872638 RepID=UPI00286BD911|nr:hypothetical protein [Armatimonas sp.]